LGEDIPNYQVVHKFFSSSLEPKYKSSTMDAWRDPHIHERPLHEVFSLVNRTGALEGRFLESVTQKEVEDSFSPRRMNGAS